MLTLLLLPALLLHALCQYFKIMCQLLVTMLVVSLNLARLPQDLQTDLIFLKHKISMSSYLLFWMVTIFKCLKYYKPISNKPIRKPKPQLASANQHQLTWQRARPDYSISLALNQLSCQRELTGSAFPFQKSQTCFSRRSGVPLVLF